MIKTYVINLPLCRERRDHILAECARFGLEPEIFPAIDGNALTETERRALLFEPEQNPLTPPELGCALSHLGVYRDMVAKNIPHALILEDDSVFTLDPRPLLSALERMPQDDPDPCVYLLTHGKRRYIANDQRHIGDVRFYRGWRGAGAYGYIMTRNAADNLIRFQPPVKGVCDWWDYFQHNDICTFHVSEKKFIGQHPELGNTATSLIEKERLSRFALKSGYFYNLEKRIPLRLKMEYFLYKLRHLHAFRRKKEEPACPQSPS